MSEKVKVKEALQSLHEGLEAVEVKLRMDLGLEAVAPHETTKPVCNVDQIRWLDREGPKGRFQLSEDFGNPEFKALLEYLQKESGPREIDNWLYWIMPGGFVVARKERVKLAFVG